MEGDGTVDRAMSIALAQNQTLVREVLGRLLADEPLVSVVAETTTIGEAAAATAAHRPDVVLVDAECVELDGAASLGLIKHANPSTMILLLADDVCHEQTSSALACGADGLTLKTVTVSALVDTIRRLARRAPATTEVPRSA